MPDEEETALFSRLRHHHYVSTLASVEGGALARWGEALSFGLVEHAVAHATELVARLT